MKFRYIGDVENMVAFGHDFSGGATPDVTEPNAIKRLSGNPFFQAVDAGDEGDDTKKKKRAAKPKETAEIPEGSEAPAADPEGAAAPTSTPDEPEAAGGPEGV